MTSPRCPRGRHSLSLIWTVMPPALPLLRRISWRQERRTESPASSFLFSLSAPSQVMVIQAVSETERNMESAAGSGAGLSPPAPLAGEEAPAAAPFAVD